MNGQASDIDEYSKKPLLLTLGSGFLSGHFSKLP
jgi:hypothetical protein